MELISGGLNLGTNGGLELLSPGNSGCLIPWIGRSVPNLVAAADITRFKKLIGKPDQPSFFISKENWESLYEGAKEYREKGYAVYGFVFCLAMTQNQKRKRDCKDYAYFRVRTLYYKEDEDKNVEYYFDKKNIAFADISKVSNPSGSFTFLYDDTASFTPQQLEDLRNEVNEDVFKKDRPEDFGGGVLRQNRLTEESKKCPVAFSNEGAIFSVERIKELFTLYQKANKSTTVSIALASHDEKTEYSLNFELRNVYFHFKINPEAKTVLPCPNPVVCNP